MMFADWPKWAEPSLERTMGDQKNEGKQNPGFTDEEKKRQNERAGQNPQEKYEKDQASNPERKEKQDPQYDPSHSQQNPKR
jgi:hypothetical protein